MEEEERKKDQADEYPWYIEGIMKRELKCLKRKVRPFYNDIDGGLVTSFDHMMHL